MQVKTYEYLSDQRFLLTISICMLKLNLYFMFWSLNTDFATVVATVMLQL